LRILSNKIQRLLKIKTEEDKLKNIDNLINNAKPPIFWQEKPMIKKQLSVWSLNDLKKIIGKEFFIGILNGIIFAIITSAIVQLWFNNINLSILISPNLMLSNLLTMNF
jgi:hypothetical protein